MEMNYIRNWYYIHEDNLERLEKKINAIRNKCIKNNLDFSYEVGEPVFREFENDKVAKFYPISVSGSIKHEGWQFAATIAHHDSGNVIRAYMRDVEIPEKYRTCGPTCEHCNKIRSRKDTYLVYNVDTQEFKQVGKGCMQEYTNGLDAEEVARYIALFDEMIKGETPSGSGYTHYYDLKELLRYAFECTRHFGYVSTSALESDPNAITTRRRVFEIMDAYRNPSNPRNQKLLEELDAIDFDLDNEKTLDNVEKSIEWIRSTDEQNNYISNLRVVCAEDYIAPRDTGLAISLSVAYVNHIMQEDKRIKEADERAARREAESKSEFVGELGQRLTVNLKSAELVTSFETLYGLTRLYKFTDNDGNIFIWYASSAVDPDKEFATLTGTVKDHSVYNGVNQTVMTRCKLA